MKNFFKKWTLTKVLAKHLALVFLVGIFALVFYVTGCQDLNFSAIPQYDCQDYETKMASCGSEEEITGGAYAEDYFDEPPPVEGPPPPSSPPGDPGRYTKIERLPLNVVDIIFVLDISPSMQEELESIARQFDTFLDRIQDIDYHIAVTTVDIERDRGEFLYFSNGKRFLSNPDGNGSVHRENVRQFQELIQRPVGTTDDERGIYALNMALDDSSHSSFFRPHGLLMAIIVSDEDERSWGGVTPSGVHYGEAPALEDYDLPETFFRKVRQKNLFYSVVVHSIIVKPGDSACQSQSGGLPGNVYAEASHPSSHLLSRYGNIQRGRIGSICDTNYGRQLGPIADNVLKARPIQLPCAPDPNRIRVRVDEEKVRYRLEGQKIYIEDQVNLGAEAKVIFRCLN